jgi:hypothetical protein
VEVVDGPLRVGGGAEDRALVVFEHLKPAGEIGSMVLADFGREIKIGAEEGGAEFRHEFLAGVAFVAILLAAEIPIEA